MAENLADGKVSISADLSALNTFVRRVKQELGSLEKGKYDVKLQADDRVTGEVKKVTKKVDELGRKKAKPKLGAEDKSTGILAKVGSKLKKLHSQKAVPKVALDDQASPMIAGISQKLTSLVAGAGVVAGLYVIGRGVKALAGEMVSGAGEMERYDAILTTVLGSAEAAGEKLKWASQFAAKTPFELPGIVEATTRLEAYGLKAEEVLPSVGDAAAAMGKQLMDAVEAVADAQTGEFERIKEFGVKAIEINSKNMAQFGLDAEAIGKTALAYTDKNGKEAVKVVDRNNRAMITSNLLAIWNEKYAGAMETMSGTWEGVISNLKDNITRMMSSAGQSIITQVQPAIQSLMDLLGSEQVKGAIDAIGQGFGTIGAEAVKGLGSILSEAAPVVEVFANALSPAIADTVAAVSELISKYIEAGNQSGLFRGVADNLKSSLELLNGTLQVLADSGVMKLNAQAIQLYNKFQALIGPFTSLLDIAKMIQKLLGEETMEVTGATSAEAMNKLYLQMEERGKKFVETNRANITNAMWDITQGIVNETPVSAGSMDALMSGLNTIVMKYGPDLQTAAANDIIAMAVGIAGKSSVPIGEVLSILQQMGANVRNANLPGGAAMEQFAQNIAAASGLPIEQVRLILEQLRTNAANSNIKAPVNAESGDNWSSVYEKMRAWFAARSVTVGVKAAGGSSAGHTGGLVRPEGIFHFGGTVMRVFHRGGEVIARLLEGEYVMQNSAVNKYGLPFMESVNRGLLPVSPLPATTGGGSFGDYRTVNIHNPVFPNVRSGRDADDLMRQVDKRAEAAAHMKRVTP